MKFTEAWANIAKENVSLKTALFVTSFCTLLLGISTLKLSLKDPLVFERSCFTSKVHAAVSEPTEQEVKVFINKALRQRFNTETQVIEGYLSRSEQKNKTKEQAELAKKDIKQFVIVRDYHILDDSISVNIDRIYSVKDVRSGFPIKLKLNIESKSRSSTNPYGLILVNTKEIKKGDK